MIHQAEYVSQVADVAEAVRDFYDRYPYPPPISHLESYQRRWQEPQRLRADFHLMWPARSYREDQSILIAGCGTSQAAKHALRHPGAQITAVDCSTTSIRCTEQLKKQYGLKNLTIHQLAIEQASELKMSFDQIVCTGVLHHLADPDAGLRALRSVLKPDGAMHLMVYAPYGRTGIYMLQEFCRRIGIHAYDREIRDLIAALAVLPRSHPLQSLLSQSPDFQNEAALADALLHPHDRGYSVPQLFEFLEKGGLTFGRWVRQAPYSVHCGVMTQIPQGSRLAHRPLAEQYAAIELFRGTMVRHSVIAYRDDSEHCRPQVSLADGDWLSQVPIRIPDTICVQDRVPPGSAAVLINRTHTYGDLFLPISHEEKVWYDGIDGVRNIRDIIDAKRFTLHTPTLDTARAFLERLWWHDQIVFDQSQKQRTA